MPQTLRIPVKLPIARVMREFSPFASFLSLMRTAAADQSLAAAFREALQYAVGVPVELHRRGPYMVPYSRYYGHFVLVHGAVRRVVDRVCNTSMAVSEFIRPELPYYIADFVNYVAQGDRDNARVYICDNRIIVSAHGLNVAITITPGHMRYIPNAVEDFI